MRLGELLFPESFFLFQHLAGTMLFRENQNRDADELLLKFDWSSHGSSDSLLKLWDLVVKISRCKSRSTFIVIVAAEEPRQSGCGGK